jgi:lipase chaperone LimK
MDRQSRERLQLDRRLIRRRGHMTQEDLERALAALPDVADKSVAIRVEEPTRKETPEPEKR